MLKHLGRTKPVKKGKKQIKCPICRKITPLTSSNTERTKTKMFAICKNCNKQFEIK